MKNYIQCIVHPICYLYTALEKICEWMYRKAVNIDFHFHENLQWNNTKCENNNIWNTALLNIWFIQKHT